MENARLLVSRSGLGRSNAGLVYANISLKVGESIFPSVDWTDFVVVVLTWWAEAMVRLLRGELERVKVRFMEGPYSVLFGGYYPPIP